MAGTSQCRQKSVVAIFKWIFFFNYNEKNSRSIVIFKKLRILTHLISTRKERVKGKEKSLNNMSHLTRHSAVYSPHPDHQRHLRNHRNFMAYVLTKQHADNFSFFFYRGYGEVLFRPFLPFLFLVFQIKCNNHEPSNYLRDYILEKLIRICRSSSRQ